MIALAAFCIAVSSNEDANVCPLNLSVQGGNATVQSQSTHLTSVGDRVLATSVTIVRNNGRAGNAIITFKDPTGRSQNGGGSKVEILWNGSPVSFVAREIYDLRGRPLYQLDTSNVGPMDRFGTYCLRINFELP